MHEELGSEKPICCKHKFSGLQVKDKQSPRFGEEFLLVRYAFCFHDD